MSERSVSRALLRLGALATAAVLAFGATSAVAFAQDSEPTTSTPTPTETVTPPPSSSTAPTPTEPPSSAEPTPSTTPESTSAPAPAPQPDQSPQPKPQPQKQPQPQIEQRKAAADEQADIAATVRFQQPSYQSHEPVWLSLTVENKGTAVAHGVKLAFQPFGVRVNSGWYGDLGWDGPGITLAPGQSRFLELYGTFGELNDGKAFFTGSVTTSDPDADTSNNTFYATVPVTQAYGNLSGRVFADQNGNGTYDSGEQIAGGTVDISNGTTAGSRQGVTDGEGRFSFENVPAGGYSAYFQLPNGWVVRSQGGTQFFVQPNTTTEVTALAERPWSDVLRASVSLDKDKYRTGETAKVTVVVTNTGDRDIMGVEAGCNRVGDPNHLMLAKIGPASGGFMVKAGETRTLTIEEIVPAAARERGEVVVACDFEPNADYDASGPQAGDSAEVQGAVGRWKGMLGHDKNGNGRVDDDEWAWTANFILTDPATGRQVESRSGPIAHFVDLPVGRYRGEIAGEWKLANGATHVDIDITDVEQNVDVLVVPAKPDLVADVRFDKPSYQLGEPIKVLVSITNKGDAAASGIYVSEPYYDEYLKSRALLDEPRWGDLSSYRSNVHVRPGETRTFEFAAKPQGPAVRVEGTVYGSGGDANPGNNTFNAQATISGGQGHASGVFYADRNDDGDRDAGEELPGVRIYLYSNKNPDFNRSATTDDEGKFSFRDLPADVYSTSYSLPDGWAVMLPAGTPFDAWTIADGTDLKLERRAVRPLTESLSVQMVLDRDAYAPGDRAQITVTLTNTGSKSLTGIRAYCVHPLGNDPSWNYLRHNQPGINLPAGGTYTRTVTETAATTGIEGDFAAWCRFGNPETHPQNTFATASDTARLLSGVGELKGIALHEPDGQWPFEGDGVEGVEIVLIDPFTGTEAARVKSGADGRFSLPGMPVGRYDLKVAGKYRLAQIRYPGGDSEPVTSIYARVYTDYVADHQVPVELAPVVDPGVRPGPDGPRPPAAPPATPEVVLAKTGASVLGIALLGGLLFAFGLGARTAARRRSA